MKTFFKIFFLFFLSLNLYSNENYIDSITLTKIKKLVQKEEEIAYAYKKYILEKGKKPTLDDLITNNYLPKGFSKTNSFGEDMSLDTSIPYYLKVSIPDNVDLKTNVFDYYYSNIYRTYTKAPLSIKNDKVEIKLSSKEKFIYTNQDNITTTTTGIANKYYLDNNGILHWYKGGVYQFSLNKDLIVDSSVNIFEADGVTVKPEFKTMISDVFFAGQTILHKNSTTNKADEYLGVADDAILKTSVLATVSKDIGLLQFGKQSGGMIVNGDIYTWGNNLNRITGIDIDKYTNSSGSEINSSTKNPVMTTLVKLKAKVYDDDLADEKDLSKFYTQNYFSSPLRSRFVDLFTNTKNGTCGITTKGELFCGGTTGDNYEFGTNFTHVDSVRNGEMLYRSTFFDGITNKAKKLFAINQLWLILTDDGYIYRWGTEDAFKNGFSGNGNAGFNSSVCTITIVRKCIYNAFWCSLGYGWYEEEEKICNGTVDKNKIPEKITENTVGVNFKDMSYIFGDGYKKIAALSDTKDLYLWGMDTLITNSMSCTEVSGMNLCQATKLTTATSNLTKNLTFEFIKGGVRAFITLGTDGKYYKIQQPKNSKIQVSEIKNGTTSLPNDILSLDLTENGTAVYVTSDNKLISSHFDSFDNTFKNTINGMLWKNIKVLDDTDAMCGLNTDNQLYCWGIQSYTHSTDTEANTYMLPVFNTNLYDSTKDYLVVEGGDSNILTPITSESTWLSSSGKFNIKYPTYIGGFNYEFIFK